MEGIRHDAYIFEMDYTSISVWTLTVAEMEEAYGVCYKVLIIGDSCVGKTTLLRNVVDQPAAQSYRTTIGKPTQCSSYIQVIH